MNLDPFAQEAPVSARVTSLLVAAAALAAGLSAPPARAAPINACYNNTNGNLRYVEDASECRTHEQFLTWNSVGPAGPAGPQGPPGSSSAIPPTQAIFGTGPITHHADPNWVLETTASNTLQLRRTGPSSFLDFGFIYPTSCAGTNSTMVSSHRFSTTVGETLTGTLCNEGSTLLVTVFDFSAGSTTSFRCQRVTSNHNMCQRY